MTFADHSSKNVVDVPSIVPTIPNLNLEVSTLEFNTSQSKLSLIRSESDRDPQNDHDKSHQRISITST